MANENRNGGPWGSGGGSGGGGGNGGPWGQPPRGGPRGGGPRGGGGGGGGQQPPPDLDDLIRQLQRGLGRLFGTGGGGGRGGRGSGGAPIILIIAVALLVWVGWPGSGWYQVGPSQVGVVLRFGAYNRTTTPGAHLKLPLPFERVELPNVTQVNEERIGFGTSGASDTESLMLTGDENIVDLSFRVQWKIDTAAVRNYLFNIENQQETVRAVSEAAMREVIGQSDLQPIISQEIASVQSRVQEKIQEALNLYEAGITVQRVLIDRPTLPQAENPNDRGTVQADPRTAFLDVQNAEQEKQRLIQEARAYANSEIPVARGDARQIVEQARGYRDSVVAEATGEADRFNLIFEQYRLAPEVTRRRMFLETMEEVLGRSNKVILDEGASGTGVVPYLPLNELGARPAPSGTNGGAVTVTGGQR